MNRRDAADDGGGARTAAGGTPFAVDVSPDRKARVAMAAFLSGPVTAIGHFMLVYLVVEAGCTGDGPGLRIFDPPVPRTLTLIATSIAAIACLVFVAWNLARWRMRRDVERDADDLQAPDPGGSLALLGLLLAVLSFLTVLFVGLPAIFLPAC
jgi:hypothetical protein